MTTEEKARTYDEALERARKQRNDYQKELNKADKKPQLAGLLKAGITAIELAFPELAESEDERIRKSLIGIVERFMADERKEKTLAWLEKQKEPTFISDLPPDDKGEPGENGILEKQKDILSERAKNITINMLEDGIEGIQRELIEFLSNTINAPWVDVIKSADAYAQRIRSMVEKQKEQKPADRFEEVRKAEGSKGKICSRMRWKVKL